MFYKFAYYDIVSNIVVVRWRIMDLLTIIFGIISIFGIVLTVYYGKRSIRLEQSRKKLEWSELQSGTNDLAAKLRREFYPEIILTPGLRGATIVNLIVSLFDINVPAFVGISLWKQNTGHISEIRDFFHIETKKWHVFIPNGVLEHKDKKLLIVDDFSMSGDFIDGLKERLIKKGFSEDNIKTLSMATTKVAISNHKAPDYYWIKTENDDFYFPWGKAK